MNSSANGSTQSGCRLYLISPSNLEGDRLPAFARALEVTLSAGQVACLQLRLKAADETVAEDDEVRRATEMLLPITQKHDAAFILNDRPDLAAELGCDGVHIGQDDASYDEARRMLGTRAIVGVTCHDSKHLAMAAAEAGADYVAFGAFFPTSTKNAKFSPRPDLLKWWSDIMEAPCVAIGGITPENCKPLVSAGADFLAVSAGVWFHPEGPGAAISAFNNILETADRATG
ncbi:MAG: thiamine phosphate synthase [Alphaproteobacteria bacterium]|nr:thiamine phosphate synthase [Alphaproteobacteria bacterium]